MFPFLCSTVKQCCRLLVFFQYAHILMGTSPQAALIVGRLKLKARVSVVMRNLKEAGDEYRV